MFKWIRKHLSWKIWKRTTPAAVRSITLKYHCHCCNRVSVIPVMKDQRFGCNFCSAIIFPTSFGSPTVGAEDESVIMVTGMTQQLEMHWRLATEQFTPLLPLGQITAAFDFMDDQQFQVFCDCLQSRFDSIMQEIWNEAGNLPMLPKDLNALTKTDLSSERDETAPMCCICAEDLKEGESLLKLPCGHLHHEVCIKAWLESHSTCPICRRFLRTTIF